LVLVDASVWIDYFNFQGAITAQTDKLDKLLGHELLAIGDPDSDRGSARLH
jgi:hypothetical protein